ncbi:MAG: Hpt domain-containing protein [Planctomycetota bacterium]|jgi:HPt (histidine-containing phosphotransfer) domain-containing protein
MGKNEKTFGSLSGQRQQSKLHGDRALAQLAAKYLRDLPQQLDGIKTTLAVKDYTAIKKQAHRIKGTSGTYRLDTISKSIAQLERLADSRNPNAIVTTIDKVKRLVELETKRLNSRPVSSAGRSERNANG